MTIEDHIKMAAFYITKNDKVNADKHIVIAAKQLLLKEAQERILNSAKKNDGR